MFACCAQTHEIVIALQSYSWAVSQLNSGTGPRKWCHPTWDKPSADRQICQCVRLPGWARAGPVCRFAGVGSKHVPSIAYYGLWDVASDAEWPRVAFDLHNCISWVLRVIIFRIFTPLELGCLIITEYFWWGYGLASFHHTGHHPPEISVH